MDRTVNPEILAIALGVHEAGLLPSPDELATLITEVEVGAIRAEAGVPDQLLGTAWYLHGIAAALEGTELYDPVRRRHAFAVSAHILELALDDRRNRLDTTNRNEDDRTGEDDDLAETAAAETTGPPQDPDEVRARRLSLAFGAQVGYRRCEQDPNAAAVFRQVDPLLVTEESLASHLDTLAVEAGVAFLGLQRRRLTRVVRVWRRQLGDLQRLAGVTDLRESMYGPAQAVIEAVHNLTLFLTRADPAALETARTHLRDVVTGSAGLADRSARWVAAHLLELLDDLADGSLQRLLPPDTPPALAQAFALSDPPVMTLWPPQRELLRQSRPLDPATSRLLISVPTSAGKTLMAQLVICAHLAAGAGRVLYVSPLRSLGREMRQALRSRLRVLGRKLGDDQPDFPAPGAQATAGDADVEVLTPERLMHALRQDANAALEGVGLIVVDEAHHMQHTERGFLLEGLLAFCQAHPSPPRLVLLSAAVGNHAELAAWLDPSQPAEDVVFTSQWRGPRRLHGLLSPIKFTDQLTRTKLPPRANRTRNTEAVLPMGLRISVRPTSTGKTFHMATQRDQPLGQRIYREKFPGDTTGKQTSSVTNYALFAFGAAHLSRAGSVLVVCSSRLATRNTAQAIAALLPEFPPAAPLAGFLADTLGADHPIVDCARHGVAYHHAQLPAEVLHAVEDALRGDQLKALCCTSTLTDGVNLPVRSVIINSEVDDGLPRTWSGQPQMGPAQLLNAVGRAGRAGRESEGWILLTRHRDPRSPDFALLEPGAERLQVLSALGTDDALTDLAAAEQLIADTADAIFKLAENHAANFASYVWFTLDALSRVPTLTTIEPMAAVDRLLAMRQLPPELKDRWLHLAAKVAEQYEATEPAARRRWTTPGTSIGTARTLDSIAEALTQALLRDPAATAPAYEGIWAEVLAGVFPDEWPLQRTLDFFAQYSVYGVLLTFPEAKEAWTFTEKRTGTSARRHVDIAAAITGWTGGTTIPDLADAWLPGLPREWALEQTVSNISVTFEHYLAWTIGALTNLINTRLEQARAEIRLPATVGWHLRHGVDTTQALALLNAGVTSRRLAHQIGQSANDRNIGAEELRAWLTDLHIDGWRREFSATSYEINDLLEYVRTRRPSMIGSLLDARHTSLHVTTTGVTVADGLPVQLRFAAGPQPSALTADVNQDTVAIIPADAYLDVLTIIDSGIDFDATLTDDRLSLRLRAAW
ncbi:DEAD/DEAH box helicase [Streptomyces sp. NPDC057617]|uniref:DEAD/DEAH box helicase n=1 Tax=Streptomyces sp. NPDC057617 TaxID=3346184 RepID=UPI0036859154